MSVFIHLVTHNSDRYIEKCMHAVLKQESFELGKSLIVSIHDNASQDNTPALLNNLFISECRIHLNEVNLGYCGGQNQGLREFLDSSAEYFLLLTPDVLLRSECLFRLVKALENTPSAGSACPKLFRCDEDLNPLYPSKIDAAGMYITKSLRHFDRGSEELDIGQYDSNAFVFGGSGACLLLRRDFVKDMLIEGTQFEEDAEKVIPALKNARHERAQLFDEAFFAYREDADLSWRAQLFGWDCLYVADALAYHRRVVVPERRRKLPPELNMYSVRNRFLLQFNNFDPGNNCSAIIPGLFRNLLVILGVLFTERTSLPAFVHLLKLFRRAMERRREIFRKAKEKKRKAWCEVGEWFERKEVVINITD